MSRWAILRDRTSVQRLGGVEVTGGSICWGVRGVQGSGGREQDEAGEKARPDHRWPPVPD